MPLLRLVVVVGLALTISPAWAAIPLAPLLNPYVFSFGFGISRDVDTYRLGSQWSRQTVMRANLQNFSPQIQQAALGVGRYETGDGYGTAFYLGQFDGQHVVATNHHVQQSPACDGSKVMIPAAGASFFCRDVLVSWPDVDLALVAIDVPEDKAAYFESIGQTLAMDMPVVRGQQLFSLGFGFAGNAAQRMTLDLSHHCRVYSNDTRFVNDPDEVHPVHYKVWSFPHGCSISQGDSGSALYDALTGQVVGIAWTGVTPAPAFAQDDSNLEALFDEGGESAWSMLNYGVPATAVGRAIRDALAQSDELKPETREFLQAFIRR